MINKHFGFLIIFIILFIIYFILKEQVETFNTIVITGEVDKKIDADKDLFRFNKLCIGETCMDSNVLSSVIDIFKNRETPSKKTICNDNVCLFPVHLEMFNNNFQNTPEIYNKSETDISKINPFNSNNPSPEQATSGFKLALIDDTNRLLNDFNLPLWNTKMMSGRICYAPNHKYTVSFWGVDDNDLPYQKDESRDIQNYGDCFDKEISSTNFRMGKPYDKLNVINIDSAITPQPRFVRSSSPTIQPSTTSTRDTVRITGN